METSERPNKMQSESEYFVSEAIMGDGEESAKSAQEKKDEIQLVSLLPEEVWEMVLNKVSHHQRREVVYLSSSFFRRLLSPNRVCFLFPRVWKIMGLKYEDSRSDPVYKEIDLNTKLAKLNPDILRLRQVCKDWCCGVDEFYECFFDPSSLGYWNLSENGIEVCSWRNTYSWGNWIKQKFDMGKPQVVSNALSHFEPTHKASGRNPFPGRYATITYEGSNRFHRQQDFLQFICNVSQLLTKYGHHFWFCQFNFVTGDRSNLEDFWQTLCTWFRLVPNLKVLSLQGYHYTEGEDEQCLQVEFPRLEKLTHISVQSIEGVAKSFMERILEQNNHIRSLQLATINRINLMDGLIELQNLTSLTVKLENMEDFLILEGWGRRYPLEKLDLRFGQEFPYIGDSRMLNCLQQWQETLTDLTIRLPRVSTRETEKAELVSHFRSRLNLPVLKRLRVTM